MALQQATFARLDAPTAAERHTYLFSATWPKSVQVYASKFLRPNPIHIFVGGSKDVLVAHENITQTVHVVEQKGEAFC